MNMPGDESAQMIGPRLWIRLTVAYLLGPVILIFCGGDAGWWQAWVYTSMLLAAGLGGRVWAERRHPGITAERQDRENFSQAKVWDKVLAPLMAVSLVFPMVIVAGLDHRHQWSEDFPTLLNLLGFGFIAFGYAFAAWALAENRFFYSVVCVQTARGHRVCDSGPYRFVRHPGYAGNVLALFGVVLALNSLWVLLPALLACVISVIRTALEDRTLLDELPGYLDYAQRVRFRLIPGLY